MGSRLSPAEETRLLEALRAGRAEGFESLVREYAPAMRAAIRRLLRSDEETDDALQEAFLAAFRALARFEGRSSLSTWLHRVAVNAALMRLRARKARPSEEVGECQPEFVGRGVFRDPPARWSELPEDPLVREELCATVRQAIAALPEPSRTALLLRDIEGLSNEALAEALGVTVNAAKIRVHRARQTLRVLLEPSVLGPPA
jgi:RNA polymerase sigma-70 factor (ECF subfamily)